MGLFVEKDAQAPSISVDSISSPDHAVAGLFMIGQEDPYHAFRVHRFSSAHADDTVSGSDRLSASAEHFTRVRPVNGEGSTTIAPVIQICRQSRHLG